MDKNLLHDVPMGFGMALAANMAAMERFAALSDVQKQKLLDGTHTITSKSEMRAYVDRIAAGGLL